MQIMILILLIAAQAIPEPRSIRLGDLVDVQTEKCNIRVTSRFQTTEGFWNYYSLDFEISNNSSDLLSVDWNRVYLVDNEGLALFSEYEDLNLLMTDSDRAIRKTRQLIADAEELLGRRGLAEIQRTRTAIEEQNRKVVTESPVEIPPGGKKNLSRKYHTPLKPKWLTLSLIGMRIGTEPITAATIRIQIADQP